MASVTNQLIFMLFLTRTISDAQWQGPMFTQQPPNRLFFSNTSGSQLTCAALGSPTPRIMWLLQNGGIMDDVPALRQTLGNGSLYFPPFRAQDYRPEVHNTVYRCRAENTIGSILSREVHVKAVVSQAYEVRVFGAHVLAGNVAVLSCVIPPHVQEHVVVTSWFKDDHILLPGRSDAGGRYIVTSVSGELHIKGARADDTLSRYSCLTLHSLTGERKRSPPAILTVTEPSGSMPPRVVHRSAAEISVERGADVHLTCAVQGNPPPTFTWYRSMDGTLKMTQPSLRISFGEGLLHIRRVESEDAGRWLCEAQNQFGSQRLETMLVVVSDLNVHVFPQVQMVNSGGTATFNCSVDGSAVSRVEWLHNSMVLILPVPSRDGAGRGYAVSRVHLVEHTGTILQIRDVVRADRGMYQCAVRNERDAAIASAELRLGDTFPELQYTFVEQTLHPGPLLSLRCSASGSPPPQFYWQRDGQPLPEVMGHRYAIGQFVESSGDVISHLNITSIRSQDGGLYSCNAANSQGISTHAARINVYGPAMTRSAGPVRGVAGGNVTLFCPYSGYPIAGIRWEHHGQNLDTNRYMKDPAGGSLHILKVDATLDEGDYTCSVSSRTGETVHATIQLIVVNPPVVQSFTFGDNVQQGSRAQVSCTVVAGDMPVYFSWTKDGMQIPSTLQVVEKDGEFFSNLIFMNISYHHSGVYTCLATNSAGKAKQSSELVVNVPPHWTSEPKDVSVLTSSSVVINCAATGFPVPQIAWLRGRGESPINYEPITSQGHVRMFENGSLRIDSCDSNDRGHYMCRATNGVGSGLSKAIYISVNEPVRFDFPSRNVSTRLGDPVNLSCDVRGDLPIQIVWFHNNNMLDTTKYRFSFSEVKTPVGLSSRLLLHRTDRQDSGVYRCQAENGFGRSEFILYLAVQESPDPPRAMEVVEISGRSIRLVWDKPFDGNSPIIHFLVQFQPLGSLGMGIIGWNNSNVLNITIPFETISSFEGGMRQSALIENLRPDKVYAFRVLAMNEISVSLFTEPVIAKTNREAPAEAPTGLQVTAGGIGELLVTWQVPPRDSWNGELLGYAVQYSEQPAGNVTRSVTVHGWASTKAQLLGLKKFTRYAVTVRAFNSIAAGPSGVPVIATTAEGVPEMSPQSLACVSLSSQSVRVTWSPLSAELIGGVLLGYKVLYRVVPDVTTDFMDSVEISTLEGEIKRTTATETYLHALQRFTNYSVQVLAYTAAGDGAISTQVACRTDEDVPGPPRNVKAYALTGDSVLVSWLSPVHGNGVVSHYSVYSRAAGRVGSHTTNMVRVDPALTPAELTSEVRGLAENQLYEFWVSASTRVGEGEPTGVVARATNTRAPARIASFSRVIRRPVGSKAQLTCIAVGNPTPRVRWLHRGRPITFSPFYQVNSDDRLTIHSVDQALNGNYTCSAKNLFGEDEITYTVKTLLPPARPVLELQYTTKSSIKVYWRRPVDGGSSILGYIISIRRDLDDWTSRELPPNLNEHILDDLYCGSRYSLNIVAHNIVGKSSPSEILTTRTKGALTIAAEHNDLINTNSTAVQLNLYSWQNGECPVHGFSVEYRALGQPRWRLVTASSKEDALFVTDLEPATWYQLRVNATNDAGTTTGRFNFATTTINGDRILPPDNFPSDVDLLEDIASGGDYPVIFPAISATVLVICLTITIFVALRRRRICCHGLDNPRSARDEDKTSVERENRRNQHLHSGGAQPVYTATPGKQLQHVKVIDESEMYEVSPYATFSMPGNGPGSRSVTASTLDYAMQFRTFEPLEDDSAPDRRTSCDRHRNYTDSINTCPKSSGNQQRSTKSYSFDNSKDSESDTSGSPCRESYKVPVKPPRKKYKTESSTESNNDVSPPGIRKTPRHVQNVSQSNR